MIKKFFAFTENIERKSVAEKADHITPSFDEFLFINKLPRAISYPKNRIKCLVVGDMEDDALAQMKKEGYNIRPRKQLKTNTCRKPEFCFAMKRISPRLSNYQNAGALK